MVVNSRSLMNRRPFVLRRVSLFVSSLSAALLAALYWASEARADVTDDLAAQLESAITSGNMGLALGLTAVGGLLSAMTPCVYPMIAITVSVFGARKAESRMQGAMLSTAFVLGMAALFTPLGVISASTGKVFGSELQNPIIMVPIAVLFVAMAASMFGAFEMNLPPSLQNRLAQVGGVGLKGAFLLGLVSGLIAAPCVGPVLIFLLGWISTTGDMVFGGLALFVYALGLGSLFWVVGTFAVSLPKSGRWLEHVKSVFGLIMLSMAFYYLKPFLPIPDLAERTPEVLATGAVLLVLGVAAGAVHLSFHDSTKTRLRKGAGISLAVAGIATLLVWNAALPAGAKIDWLHDYDEAKALAERTQKPLLVDFTAEWCGACGEISRDTLSDPRVVHQAQDFIPVKVDLTDMGNEKGKAALKRYNQTGLPLVVLHSRKGGEVHRVTQPIEADKFLGLMEDTQTSEVCAAGQTTC